LVNRRGQGYSTLTGILPVYFWSLPIIQYLYVILDDDRNDEMGAARNGENRHANRVSVGKYEGKRQCGKPEVYGIIILKWILRKKDGVSVDWIDLALDRNKRHTAVTTLIILRPL
jgi:hypothetical protein